MRPARPLRNPTARHGPERLLNEWSGYSLRLDRSTWTRIGILTAVIVGSALGVGAVHVPILIVVSLMAAAAAALCARSAEATWAGLPCVALCLAAFSLLQAIPLPLHWLAEIAPHNAEVWIRASRPFGDPPPNWATLSLDPGATLVEVLKWSSYAATLFTAAFVRRIAGKRIILLLVFSSAVLVGAVSIAHWLTRAEALFGVYHPRFAWEIAPFLNPNNLAGYLSLGAFSGLGLLLDPRQRTAKYRWFLGTAVSGLISLVVLTGSRAGLAALGLGLLAVAGLTFGRSDPEPRSTRASFARGAPLLTAIAGGGVFAAFSMRPTMVHELLDQGMQKLDVFKWTLPMIRDHLWLGVGRGAFETAFQPYRQGGGNAVFTHAENFVIQWISEWGAPVAVAGLVSSAVLLRPRLRTKKRLDPVGACAFVGVAALLAQNLFDLALEIPAVAFALCAVCGALSGKRSSGSRARNAHPRLHSAGALAFVTLEIVGLVGAALLGRHTAIDDRDLLRRAYQAVRQQQPGARDHFDGTLRQTLARHPGDGYLPLLAGIAAQSTNPSNALRWFSQALDRDPMNGRTHLALAQELAKRGATAQALLELRLATEREAALVPKAARWAVRWAGASPTLLEAVPEGITGADMLVTMAKQVDASRKDELLREALLRNPDNADAHLDLGISLVDQVKHQGGACLGTARDGCSNEITAHVAALRRVGSGAQWARLEASRLAAFDEPEPALTLLDQACPGAIDQRICYAVALDIAANSNTRLEPTIVHYLGSCNGPQDCAQAEIDVGNLLSARQHWGTALSHYTRAAQILRNAEAWLRVAETAERAGAHAEARTAVERAEKDPDLKDPEIRRRLSEIERRAALNELPAVNDGEQR